MGRARIDISGQRFGKLTVIKYSYSSDFATYWLCKCDCGNICTVKKDALRYGNTKSCGCLKKKKDIIDITGQKFGKLTVLELSEYDNINKQYIWKCKCDCGNISYVRSNNLKSGNTVSCGCNKVKDLVGQRFGRLVVEKYIGSSSKYHHISTWLCRCDCGNTKIVERGNLISGNTKSCGCLRKKIKYESKYHSKEI